jgi:XTP/dITP diphosphohydrolase
VRTRDNASQRSAKVLLASGNPGKLREFRAMASQQSSGRALDLELVPNFSQLPAFEESAPTFAENAAGKALHYSRFTDLPLFADDSGLVVDALGGAPGVHSARYAGPSATDADRLTRLLSELRSCPPLNRTARFVCILALARRGEIIAVFSDSAEGQITGEPRGSGGFGYDPVFLLPALGKTYAELSSDEKGLYSHRGKAFRKLLSYVTGDQIL